MSVSECKVPYRSGFCVGLGVSSFTGEAAVRPWAFPDFARPQLNTEMDEEGAQPRTGRTTLLGIQWAGTWSVLPASQAKTVSLLVM